MKHLILGSSGQVGHHLVRFLKNNNEEVILFDITNNQEEDLRIYNNSLLEEAIASSDFVHFLAFDIGGSLYMKKYQDTYNFISNNIKIMCNVFEMLSKHSKPFIFASSQMSNMSYSTYGILKSIGEKYTQSLNGLVVKFWNVYGYETDEEKSHVITDFIKMAKRTGVIKMRTDGKELRQFLYGDDCAECLFTLSKQYDSISRSAPLHITSFEWNSILDIANVIREITNCVIEPSKEVDTIQLDKRNEPDPYILNFWKPRTSLKLGVREIFKFI